MKKKKAFYTKFLKYIIQKSEEKNL
jgi:hypothetical protein